MFCGRGRELDELNRRYRSDGFQFIPIYGRRRGNRFAVRNPGSMRIPLDIMLEGGVNVQNLRLTLMMGLIGLLECVEGEMWCQYVARSASGDRVCRNLGVPIRVLVTRNARSWV